MILTITVMRNRYAILMAFFSLNFACLHVRGQDQELPEQKQYKNVIRYDLSGALLMGFDQYIVFGYERILKKNQSFSINAGPVALAKSSNERIAINDFTLRNDPKSNGFNVSLDYRFYLGKENKYAPPRGIYIGPYMSYNMFHRESVWSYASPGVPDKTVTTEMDMKIFSVGAELGYQFVLWKRMAIDILLIGPGIGNYNIDLAVSGNLTEEEKQKLREAVKEVITEKYVGLNYILANKSFDPEGTIKSWSLGYRYIIHIGYAF
ncbi:MAG TPA: DUF3575 domain-containing protein [Flavitalea sp.]|nr:DUF3575 domain-containing protein [Flavitalea sp.]